MKGLTEVTIDKDCICPGDTVTYQCTVDGDYGGFTLWKGKFFNCLSPQNHENYNIVELRHSQLLKNNDAQGGEAKECNDGDIVGRIVRVENDSFISHLNITLTSAIIGKEIECSYDNGTIYRVGSLNITKG